MSICTWVLSTFARRLGGCPAIYIPRTGMEEIQMAFLKLLGEVSG